MVGRVVQNGISTTVTHPEASPSAHGSVQKTMNQPLEIHSQVVDNCMQEARSTGLYSNDTRKSLSKFPEEFRFGAGNRRSSGKHDNSNKSTEIGKYRSQTNQPSNRFTNKNGQKFKTLNLMNVVDTGEKLSDDRFTAEYDQDVWKSLPLIIKKEIQRQRVLKKMREAALSNTTA